MKNFYNKPQIIISYLFLILFVVNSLKAQTLNKPLEEFLGTFVLPIELGNVWNYRNFYFQPEVKISLVDTLNIDGKKYYLKKQVWSYDYVSAYQYVRLREDGFYVSRVLDSMLTFFPNEDYLYYKKNAKIGDVWSQMNEWNNIWYHIVLDTIQVASFWGSYIPVKIVEVTDSSLTRYWEYWSDEFGLVRQQYPDLFSGGWLLLWGCYIDGQQYGDTTLVSVENENPDNPSVFKLFQNYPNPFNSSTIIPYEVSRTSFVTLKVYDLLGQEIAKLVNEIKPPGKYTVEFNSDNFVEPLSSNIYVYQITVDQKKEIKKMIYLK